VRSFYQARALASFTDEREPYCEAALRDMGIKPVFGVALALACLLGVAPKLYAQAQDSSASGSGKNKPAANSQSPDPAQQPNRTQTQTNANPFPEDTTNVPVMPTRDTLDLPPDVADAAKHMSLPVDDVDPVRSPEDEGDAAQSREQNSSSSLAGMSDLLPGADDETQPGKRGKKGTQIAPEHHETATEDENVGSYYLDQKNWKAALSRYQSAMVLDPDNPEVYWGLAESERHLGDLASARENYKKVVDYDPDSRHGKEARKALGDPAIANAKSQANAQPSPPAQ
jgi:tetratricopeptide (TPR) repeat protein